MDEATVANRSIPPLSPDELSEAISQEGETPTEADFPVHPIKQVGWLLYPSFCYRRMDNEAKESIIVGVYPKL